MSAVNSLRLPAGLKPQQRGSRITAAETSPRFSVPWYRQSLLPDTATASFCQTDDKALPWTTVAIQPRRTADRPAAAFGGKLSGPFRKIRPGYDKDQIASCCSCSR